ncbi:hypothetical protein P7C70_g2697, partial [Phenoliferia sp. Uapishka_3]
MPSLRLVALVYIAQGAVRVIGASSPFGYLDAVADASLLSTLAPSYSYIIVGGGTGELRLQESRTVPSPQTDHVPLLWKAGLAVASRLTEDPTKTVLVLEAGSSHEQDPGVQIPGLAGSTFGTGVDWQFSTTPQASASGRSIAWPRGKCLSGSSALNFMVYARGEMAAVNAWNTLGNTGWSWSSLLPYFKKEGVESLDTLNFDTAALNEALAAFGTGQGILTQGIDLLGYLNKGDLLNTADQSTALTLVQTLTDAIAEKAATMILAAA